MSIDAARMEPLVAIHPQARVVVDGTKAYVLLPGLHITVGHREYVINALLSPNDGSGYPTRLYLAEQITERQAIGTQPANWTTHTVCGATWFTWSWTGVPSSLPLVDMLLAHLKALQ